jgi:hypothetical protein
LAQLVAASALGDGPGHLLGGRERAVGVVLVGDGIGGGVAGLPIAAVACGEFLLSAVSDRGDGDREVAAGGIDLIGGRR